MSPYVGPWLLPVSGNISKNAAGTSVQRAIRKGRPHGKWSTIVWRECLAAWGARCAYCGNMAQSQDHYIPLSATDSPGTVPWNMVPACNSCNHSKGNKDPWEFMMNMSNKITKRRCKRWGTVVAYLEAMKGRYGTEGSDNYNLHFV